MPIQIFRKVSPGVWDDFRFKQLPNDAKLGWLYVLTNQQSTRIGLYELNPIVMCSKLGLKNVQSADEIIQTLESAGMLSYDRDNGLVWVHKWLAYDMPDGKNQSMGRIAQAERQLPHPYAKALLLMMLPLATAYSHPYSMSSEQLEAVAEWMGLDTGIEISPIDACAAVVSDLSIAEQFSSRFAGSGSPLLWAEEVADLLPDGWWEIADRTPSERRSNAVGTPSERVGQRRSNGLDNAVGTRKEVIEVIDNRATDVVNKSNITTAPALLAPQVQLPQFEKLLGGPNEPYYPTISNKEKRFLLLETPERLSNKVVAGLLFDLLIHGKKNGKHVLIEHGVKAKTTRSVAQAVHKFGIPLMVECFTNWEHVPASLFGALTNARYRNQAIVSEEDHKKRKEVGTIVPKSSLTEIAEAMSP